MGKHKEDVCPGCSRHCPLSHVRCKYGQKYAEKQRRTLKSAPEKQTKASKKERQQKWKKYTAKDSAAWTLLETGRRLKQALRKGTATEQQIHLALSNEEQTQLRTQLEKINRLIS